MILKVAHTGSEKKQNSCQNVMFFALCELFCYSWCMTLALYLGRYVIQNMEVYRIICVNFNPQVHISRWFEWFILKFSNIFAVALPLSCSHNLRLLRQFWKFELSIYVYEMWNLLTIYNNQRELQKLIFLYLALLFIWSFVRNVLILPSLC